MNFFLIRDYFLKYSYVILLLFYFGSNTIYSQDYNKYDPNIKTLCLALNDGEQLVLNPLHWESSSWLTFAAVAGGTMLLTTVDEKINNEVLEKPYKNTVPLIIGKWTGEPLTTFSIAGGFYIFGIATEDNAAKRIGFEVVESFIYAGTINIILKAAIGRYRPYTQKGNGSFRPFNIWNNDNLSFPSGHSTVAFSLSTILASHTDSYLLKAVIYTPAVLTLVQRVEANQHWTSDVFAGAAIGYFVGKFIIDRHKEKDSQNQKYNLSISPEGRLIFYMSL